MKIVRHVESRSIFLTFDDGPSEQTPKVLDVLREENVRATFFVVARQAALHRSITEQTVRDGHAIGHHSLDHTYAAFFAAGSRLRDWINEGELALKDMGISSVGFRPPNGIVTPPLRRILAEKKEPLILWNVRFYDAIIPWTSKRAISSLKRTTLGSIVLLHDAQKESRIDDFCRVLREYIREAKRQGLTFDRLTSELVRKQSFS